MRDETETMGPDPAITFDRAIEAVAAGRAAQDVAAEMVAVMTGDERLWCLDGDFPLWAGLTDLGQGGYHQRTFDAAQVERLGFPGFSFSDGPRGVVIGPATCFPVSMARGATWDPDLEERVGDAIGRELRAVGADLYGGVCVNLLRHPAWGRAQETYGEDPLHVGTMGVALTRGIQRHAMACVKHFACNSIENARFKVDVEVDEAALHEVYLPQFRRIVAEGVASVMTAYNKVNGEWCSESRHLLTEILRDEWGFEGFVISDWIFGLRDGPKSVTAGLDVEMPYRFMRADTLRDALDGETLTWAEIDAAVARVVATRLRFAAVLAQPRPGGDVLACPEHRDLAREVAARSVVLLRNEPVLGGDSRAAPLLPLDPERLRRVAVLGHLAAVRNQGDGGSSEVWAPSSVTALDGLRAALPGVEVVHGDGSDPAADARLAASCDVAVVVVGYTKADEGEFIGAGGTAHLAELFPATDEPEVAERFNAMVAAEPGPEPPAEVLAQTGGIGFGAGGDRRSLRLHPDHEALIAAVSALQPATVVCVVAGSAVLMPWAQQVSALALTWYGGMEAGHGLADVLVGRVEPAGRLPFTVVADEAHLPPFDPDADDAVYDAWHGWWRLRRDGHEPAYPFGFGLSYTTFEVRGEGAAVTAAGDLRVSGVVRDGGSRGGSEVVQVYGEALDDERIGSVPARRLLGFTRVAVDPGDASPFEVLVNRADLTRRDPDRHRQVVRGGAYRIELATDAQTTVATYTVDLDGGRG